MDLHTRDYKKIANYTGLCLCIFLVAFFILNILSSMTSVFGGLAGEDIDYTVLSVAQMISYLVSFIVPAVVLRAMLSREALAPRQRLELRLPPSSLLLIPAALAVSISAAYINSLLLSPLNLTDAYMELWGTTDEPYKAYEIFIMFISTALVPAVCEELLFRETILSSLLPFGKGVATVFSAVLFGLMHQNPYQILYTTVMGVILGYAYIKTRSIWCPMIIHFCNNAFSVLEQVISANCSEEVSALVIPLLDVIIIIGGLSCLVIYLLRDAKQSRERLRGGSFGRLIEMCDDYEAKPVSPANKLKCFFAPWMTVYVIIALLSSLLTVPLLLFSELWR